MLSLLLLALVSVVHACPAGSQGGLGPPGLVWTGGLNATGTYTYTDAVYYSGSAYFCNVETCLGSAVPPSSPDIWSLLCAKGATGNNGLPGSQGQQGIQGIQGPAGSITGLATPPDVTYAIGGRTNRYTGVFALSGYFNTSLTTKTVTATGAINAASVVASGSVNAASVVASAAIAAGGALGVGGAITTTSTTASTTTTTGALIVAGGAGIAGAVNVGGAISTASTTASTTTTTGALVVAGGVGIAGAVNTGGAISTASTIASTTTGTGALVVAGGAGIAGAVNVGGIATFGGGMFTSGLVISAAATLTAANSWQIIAVSTASSFTITLPTITGSVAYTPLVYKFFLYTFSGSNTITIATPTSDLFGSTITAMTGGTAIALPGALTQNLILTSCGNADWFEFTNIPDLIGGVMHSNGWHVKGVTSVPGCISWAN